MALLLVGVVVGALAAAFQFLQRRVSRGTGSSVPLRVILWMILVVGVAGIAGLAYWLTASDSGIRYAQASATRPAWDAVMVMIGVFYFMIMIAGMCAEYMFGLKSLADFNLGELVRPFWVSLIVFSVPWSTIDRSGITFASVVACYQNGFFWKKVLEKAADAPP